MANKTWAELNNANTQQELLAVLASGQNADGSDFTPPTTQVVGNTALITPTVTGSTTPAYSVGDSLGGKITLSSAVRLAGGTAVLQSIMLLDRSNQKPTGMIYIFDSDPTTATLTDNAAAALSTADLKVLAAIPVVTDDWVSVGTKALANLVGLGRVLKAVSGTTLYAAFVLDNTPTLAATTDVQMRFGLLRD